MYLANSRWELGMWLRMWELMYGNCKSDSGTGNQDLGFGIWELVFGIWDSGLELIFECGMDGGWLGGGNVSQILQNRIC